MNGALVLAALDREAIALGLGTAMKLADARARVPDLLAFDHKPLANATLLEKLVIYCERYTPIVAIAGRNSLILDMTGCAHLYPSEKALAARVELDFDGLGFSVQYAWGVTGDAALAMASFGLKEGAEMQLPIEALRMDERKHQALQRAGLYHIGDLAERPRAPLAARFGAELVFRLERLLGQEDEPVNPLRRLDAIMVERRFAEPLGYVKSAVLCFSELFIEATQQLEERHQGARLISMRLFRCDGHIAPLQIETSAPTRDVALFKRLLSERIDSLNDPLDPGFGYDLLRLSIPHVEPLKATQITMDGERDVKADEAALLGQISIRLGRDSVRRFAIADSHIPEHSLYSFPVLDTHSTQSWHEAAAEEAPQRPLFLFDPPQAVRVIAEVPDGPPRHFVWRQQTHYIVRAEGPERFTSQWWRRREGYLPGKAGLTRDYYRIEDSEGRRYWLFRHGLYGEEDKQPIWYIHGTFA